MPDPVPPVPPVPPLRSVQLIELDRDTALSLVATEVIGRVALPGEPPAVIPLTFVLDGTSILVRTTREASIAAHVGQWVTFEADGHDDRLRAGWSVVVSGPLTDATDEIVARPHTAAEARLHPWAPGDRDCWLRIASEVVSGRALRGGGEAPPG
jgi:nitroimidazol reductase NimA-like FMN-containing flavoprotein (pyridoxamine 5'-phosphate oxidase superfamily)